MLSRLFVPDTFDYMIAGYVVLTVVWESISPALLCAGKKLLLNSLPFRRNKKAKIDYSDQRVISFRQLT